MIYLPAINGVALIKGPERYILLFTDRNKGRALRQIGRMATDERLSFTWYDAALLSAKIRQGEFIDYDNTNRLG